MQPKTCPNCTFELPIDEFGIDRSRQDGLNPYCKSCVREKMNKARQRLREYNARKKEITDKKAIAKSREPLFVDLPALRYLRPLSPVEKVAQAILSGAKTQRDIRKAARLNDNELGDALVHLLLGTREIRTEVIDGERVYFINELKPEVIRKPSLPASFSTMKGLMPVMKGEKKIGGWIAA